ncbi:hypothetical protein L486_00833 [Kwoniella mangroviensis CBS 10435]|uniref:Uncharacterized protein n=1 Tax=Kwoniella mangroviensis CBS 10435 TaxID=1331196 RepID=A0A1B9J081_9TREE|nr:hypothetical protein L486_00833 [Kwoniella mangroviensis CBS 10435]
MAKKKSTEGAIAIQPSAGKKLTFDDVDDDTIDQVNGTTSSPRRQVIHEDEKAGDWTDEDSDDDDAPEAVGMSRAMEEEKKIADREAALNATRKAAAKARSQAISQAKAESSTKGKGKGKNVPNPPKSKSQKIRRPTPDSESEEEEEDEDEETKRLRSRMEAAMAQASNDDSELDYDDDEDQDDDEEEASEDQDEEEEEEDQQSFHTDSEDEEGDPEEGDETDDSEDLSTVKIDESLRGKFAAMQAMMEAAESRAKGSTSTGGPSNAKKVEKKRKVNQADSESSDSASGSESSGEPQEEDDETQWDLIPGAPKPLSKAVLARAAELEKAKKENNQLKVEELNKQIQDDGKRSKKRRKGIKEKTEKKISDQTTLQILPPTFNPSTTSLPPLIVPRRKASARPAGKASKDKFMKRAMNNSGVVPGRGMIDGRRKIVG